MNMINSVVGLILMYMGVAGSDSDKRSDEVKMEIDSDSDLPTSREAVKQKVFFKTISFKSTKSKNKHNSSELILVLLNFTSLPP